MKTVYVLRGISGSGKSQLAKAITSVIYEHVPICSTDLYFMDNKVYQFDPSKLAEYHQRNFDRFYESLGTYDTIIVDNTNTQKWEYQEYVKAAEKAGYSVIYIVLSPKDINGVVKLEYVKECHARNSHGVPYESVLAQANRFEV